MKILVASAFFPPVTTGSSHFSSDVAHSYASLGHEVLVVTTTPPRGSETFDDDTLVVTRLRAIWISLGLLSFNYRIPFIFRLSNFRNLRRIFRDFQPDIVHVNSQLFDLSLFVSVFAARYRVPKVVTIHTPLVHPNRLFRMFMSLIDRFMLGPVLTFRSTTIVGVDQFTVSLYNRRYRFKTGEVRFIPATFVPPLGNPERNPRLGQELGLKDKKVILSLGHVIPIRSRLPLVAALAHVRKKVPNVVVVVVGEIFDDSFLRLAKTLGVDDLIVTTGRVSRESVGEYIALADMECHDLDGHGIGITTLEVMSLGVPVFATVNDEVFPGSGMLENQQLRISLRTDDLCIGREIVSLLTIDDVERASIAEAQVAFVNENFSTKRVSDAYLTLFKELKA